MIVKLARLVKRDIYTRVAHAIVQYSVWEWLGSVTVNPAILIYWYHGLYACEWTHCAKLHFDTGSTYLDFSVKKKLGLPFENEVIKLKNISIVILQ